MSDYSNVGAQIKKIRNENNLTLKQLSEKTNLSTGFLSQLERGLSNVAIDSLVNIANALDVTIQDLLNTNQIEQESESLIIRDFEKKVISINPTLHSYVLTHAVHDIPFLPREYHLLPNFADDIDLQTYSHEGTDWIYVLEGILSVTVDNQRFDLFPGDTITIDSTKPHNWQNRGSKTAKFLAINSPNPFKK